MRIRNIYLLQAGSSRHIFFTILAFPHHSRCIARPRCEGQGTRGHRSQVHDIPEAGAKSCERRAKFLGLRAGIPGLSAEITAPRVLAQSRGRRVFALRSYHYFRYSSFRSEDRGEVGVLVILLYYYSLRYVVVCRFYLLQEGAILAMTRASLEKAIDALKGEMKQVMIKDPSRLNMKHGGRKQSRLPGSTRHIYTIIP